MDATLMRRGRLRCNGIATLLSIVLLCVGCRSVTEVHESGDLFDALAHVGGGLNYPHSEDRLRTCVTLALEGCLDSFTRASCAKKTLESRKTGLVNTLEVVKQNCQKDRTDPMSIRCQGALTALAFFDASADDKLIQKAMAQFPADALETVLSLQGDWLARRQDKANWVNFWKQRKELSEPMRQQFADSLYREPRESLTLLLEQPVEGIGRSCEH